MTGHTLLARSDQNILTGSVVAEVGTPSLMATYTLSDVLRQDPSERIRFSADTVDLSFTLDAPAQGDVFFLPCSNCDDVGSPSSSVRVRNGAGLDVTPDVPGLRLNRIPRGIVMDMSETETSSVTRNSGSWRVTLSAGAGVVLGGGIGIYPKTILDPDLQWGFGFSVRSAVVQTQNDYLKRYRSNLRTQEEILDAIVRTPIATLAILRDFYDANFGAALPGLLWPQIPGFDAYLGIWLDTFEVKNVPGAEYYDVRMQFAALSKGKPV